ncbi:hypothetical protein N9Z83_00255 [Akkermansiaceae bacterium]|nr:hypothetical protein [Akkermansiaceae bacterium]
MKQTIFFCILTVIVIGLLPVRFGGSTKYSDLGHAHRNARTVYLALLEFEEIYGQYPTEEVPEDLIPNYPQKKRSDSNFLLGQLIASGALDSEKYFTIRRSSLHDDIIEPPDKILEAGECQFSYISKVGEIPYSTRYGSSALPILMFPMIPGTNRFDSTFFERQRMRGFYLKLDGSVGHVHINDEGEGILRGQAVTTLFTFGEDTIWGENKPLVHHPLSYDGEPSADSIPRSGKRRSSLPIEKTYSLIIGIFLISLAIAFYLFERIKKAKAPRSDLK